MDVWMYMDNNLIHTYYIRTLYSVEDVFRKFNKIGNNKLSSLNVYKYMEELKDTNYI